MTTGNDNDVDIVFFAFCVSLGISFLVALLGAWALTQGFLDAHTSGAPWGALLQALGHWRTC